MSEVPIAANVASGLKSRRIEPPGELAIGIVAQLGSDDRALPGEEQKLAIGGQRADFIGGETISRSSAKPAQGWIRRRGRSPVWWHQRDAAKSRTDG